MLGIPVLPAGTEEETQEDTLDEDKALDSERTTKLRKTWKVFEDPNMNEEHLYLTALKSHVHSTWVSRPMG